MLVLFAASLHAATTQTQVIVFSPWSHGTVRHELAVSKRVDGSCWIHSLASDRPDAWRCMERNEIYDPCFSGSSSGDNVACPEGPFATSIVVIRLKKPLDPAGELKLAGGLSGLRLRAAPWGLRLTSGATCQFVSGATDVIDGMRLNYACTNGSWIVGTPDRSTAIWKAFFVAKAESTHLLKIGIVAAVF